MAAVSTNEGYRLQVLDPSFETPFLTKWLLRMRAEEIFIVFRKSVA